MLFSLLLLRGNPIPMDLAKRQTIPSPVDGSSILKRKRKNYIQTHFQSKETEKKHAKQIVRKKNGAAKPIPAELREKLCALKNTKKKKKKK